jgi:hypothetical protein
MTFGTTLVTNTWSVQN